MNGKTFRVTTRSVFLVSCFKFLVSSATAQCAGEWVHRMPAVAPSPLFNVSMAYDSARAVTVLFGGGNPGVTNDTWEWNGTNWTHKTPATSPPARVGGAMAYDSVRGVCILFGGESFAGPLGDTWEYDGTNWTQRSTSTTPSARDGAGMVFDSARGVSVLFGGINNGFTNNETWEWDGSNWSMKMPANAPSERSYFGMAFDSSRGVTVLFGGYSGTGILGETWEWDGTNWSQRSSATAPVDREHSSMCYDSSRSVVVLFGGLDTGMNYDNDTSEWNGNSWALRTPVARPSKRDNSTMVFDSARQVSVLFGGNDSMDSFSDTWEWTGPGPSISQQPSDTSVASGASASFAVTAAGNGPFTYHWARNATLLAEGGANSGTTTATLTVNPADTTNSGNYDCRVGNSCGETISRAAVLSIEAPATPQSATCGTCGPGSTMMMPMTVLGLMAARRRWRRTA